MNSAGEEAEERKRRREGETGRDRGGRQRRSGMGGKRSGGEVTTKGRLLFFLLLKDLHKTWVKTEDFTVTIFCYGKFTD